MPLAGCCENKLHRRSTRRVKAIYGFCNSFVQKIVYTCATASCAMLSVRLEPRGDHACGPRGVPVMVISLNDRTMILQAGRLVTIGPTSEVLHAC
jgi:hypothetical protein